ncbi:hypothetical protein SHIRM173S_02561 [Streptomyces hirsutus]
MPRPRRELVAHRRLCLAPGETAEIAFELPLSAFAFWDVAVGRWRVEPGRYELLAGASSADVRQRTTLTLDGEPAVPRAVLEHGLDAAGFDEQSGTEIVDRTKESGDAVTPVAGQEGELVFRRCDFGNGAREVTVEVSGEGTVELSLDDGPVLAGLSPTAPASGPYEYVTLGAPLASPGAPVATAGVHEVRLRLRGTVRLARVGFSA